MKILIALSVFIISFYSQADEVGLLSTSQKAVTEGDLVTLKIVDTRDKQYYLQYKNKRIGALVYALDITEKQGELYFEAIVSEAGPKEKDLKIKDKFVLKGVNYYPSKKSKMMDFITLNIPIELAKEKGVWVYIIIALILLISFGWWISNRDIRMRQKRQQRIKDEKISKLLGIITKANTQSDFSSIYLHRKCFYEYFDLDFDKFEKIIMKLDEIQYQEHWPEDKFAILKQEFKSIKNNIKVKSGI